MEKSLSDLQEMKESVILTGVLSYSSIWQMKFQNLDPLEPKILPSWQRK